MRDTRRRACSIMLASAGLMPAAAAPPDSAAVIEGALGEARRRLALEEFLLKRMRGVGDHGISPSYLAEVEAAKARVFEAKALVLALEKLAAEFARPKPVTPAGPSPAPPAPAAAPGPSRPSNPDSLPPAG